ncbi:MAG: tetratricopeptide repeat protein [Planctomycetes bacterium]|nr:tetratricopeptide repeat protein [Planctomycetota bacterium]
MPMSFGLAAACALPLVGLGLGFAKATSGGGGGAGKKLAAIDKLWAKRDGAGVPEKVIAECEALLADDPAGFEANWRIARAAWWLANRSAEERTKETWGAKGIKHGEAAFKAAPDAVEGHLWYACALGEYGLGISILKALARGLDSDFRSHAERAIELDKTCELGAPLRALGRFFARLPWPKRDLKKAEALLRQALVAAPKSLLSRLFLAETLLDLGRSQDALPVLEEVMKQKPDADETADAGWIRELAERHLAKLGAPSAGKGKKA